MAVRTEQQEIIYQLKLIEAQLNPGRVLIQLGLWLGLFLSLLAIPNFVFLLVSGGLKHQQQQQPRVATVKPLFYQHQKHVATTTKGSLYETK